MAIDSQKENNPRKVFWGLWVGYSYVREDQWVPPRTTEITADGNMMAHNERLSKSQEKIICLLVAKKCHRMILVTSHGLLFHSHAYGPFYSWWLDVLYFQ
ncbi:hypothetical protein GN956_G7016 [Arapaima gigas]